MKINKIIIGNKKMAYIEDRFKNGINIISSDDNNKGKTIVIQSIMYALGNDPIFPDTFDYKNYYYIVEIEIASKKVIKICRKTKSFTVILNDNLFTFDNLTEYKYFINKSLFPLPRILKDGLNKIVDPMLFFQIFFVGQDNKDTSNIFLHGYYNKNDFKNMLYSYSGIKDYEGDTIDNENIKKHILSLKNEKEEIKKQNKILKSVLPAVRIGSASNDRRIFEKKLSKIDKLKKDIIKLSVARNKATSRKIKNEITLKELRSLNQSLKVGELHCLDCESTRIGFSSADNSSTFDISSTEIRNQILSSIIEKIDAYNEEIENANNEINQIQEELKSLLSEEDVSVESLLMYKPELIKASDADTRLTKIDNLLKESMRKLEANKTISEDIQIKKQKLLEKIFKKMNEFYHHIDPDGDRVYNNLFSKRQSTYSGVEATEFYLSKLYAFMAVFEHKFPIIMDYFRAEELSSSKEEKLLEIFSKSGNQVIFTATLKNQELGKYDNLTHINHIDYISHKPYKLLSSIYVNSFLNEIKKFSITL